MKKIFTVLCIAVFVFSLVLVIAPDTVQASRIVREPAEGTWNTGTEVVVDLGQNPAPYTWIQLLGKGVQVTKKTEICHPFRGAFYHWNADIRQLVDGKWVKLPTSTKWITTDEGTFSACATAPSAGTYALFGYYNGPRENGVQEPTPQPCLLSMETWDVRSAGDSLVFTAEDLAEGEMVHFKITENTSGNVTFTGEEGDSILNDEKANVFANLTGLSQTGPWTINVDITAQGCTRSFPVHGGDD